MVHKGSIFLFDYRASFELLEKQIEASLRIIPVITSCNSLLLASWLETSAFF